MKEKESLKQLQTLDTKMLAKELAASNKKIVTLRFDAKFRKLKNVKEIKSERKRIARIWTLLGEKAEAEISRVTKNEVKDAK